MDVKAEIKITPGEMQMQCFKIIGKLQKTCLKKKEQEEENAIQILNKDINKASFTSTCIKQLHFKINLEHKRTKALIKEIDIKTGVKTRTSHEKIISKKAFSDDLD